MFDSLFGAEAPLAVRFVIAFVIVLLLIGATFWLIRRFAADRLNASTARGRQPRLAVIDSVAVDSRRRLVLIRRDNVEHLLMIGGPSDVVIEPNIVRAVPVTLPREMPGPGRSASPPDVARAKPGDPPGQRSSEPPPGRSLPDPEGRGAPEPVMRGPEPLRPGAEPFVNSPPMEADQTWQPTPPREFPRGPMRPRPPGVEANQAPEPPEAGFRLVRPSHPPEGSEADTPDQDFRPSRPPFAPEPVAGPERPEPGFRPARPPFAPDPSSGQERLEPPFRPLRDSHGAEPVAGPELPGSGLRPMRQPPPLDPRRPPLPVEARVVRPGEPPLRTEPIGRGEPPLRPDLVGRADFPTRPEPPGRPEHARFEPKPRPEFEPRSDTPAAEAPSPADQETPTAPEVKTEAAEPASFAPQRKHSEPQEVSPPTADAELANMAQRLEAALRRPFSAGNDARPLGKVASAPAVEAPSTPPKEIETPEPVSEISAKGPSPTVTASAPVTASALAAAEPKPPRAEAKPAPARTVFDSLEEEMASLLGRPKSKE